MRMRSRKKTTRAKKTAAKSMSYWTLGIVVCVVATAALLIASLPSKSGNATTAKAQQIEVPAPAKANVRVETKAPAAKAADRKESPAAKPDAKPEVQASIPTTMTGCLERDNDSFQLKNAIGPDVPRTRTWKSGFIKKGTPSIEVVEASNTRDLPNHLGQQVRVVGTLVDREMRVRSLQRVSSSCS